MKHTKKVYSPLGASNHSQKDRVEYDYYATNPQAVEYLLTFVNFHKKIMEPACGENHIANVLRKHGHDVVCYDIINRTHDGTINIQDFLQTTDSDYFDGDIITNPPYNLAKEFVERSMETVKSGNYVAMYLKLTFLEGKKRKELFKKDPPKYVYVSSSRMGCAENGELEKDGNWPAGAVAYAWYIWQKGFTGEPVIRWFN